VDAFFGATYLSYPKNTWNLSSEYFRQHPGFNPKTLANDIALIYLPVSIALDRRFKDKVKLPAIASSYSTYDDQKAIATGWGYTSDTAGGLINTLQYETFEVVSEEVCQNAYGPVVANPNVICTATPDEKSICKGDFGGPLVLVGKKKEQVQIGISSFVSSAGCKSGQPAGFTRVTSYLEWIKEVSGIFY